MPRNLSNRSESSFHALSSSKGDGCYCGSEADAQCDQMARLFVKYLWIFGPLCQRTKCTIQRKSSNFCQILNKLNKPSKIAQDAKFRQSCKILRNLVTLLRLWVSLGSLGSSQSQCFIFYFLSNSTISLEGSNTFNSRWLISLSFTFSLYPPLSLTHFLSNHGAL